MKRGLILITLLAISSLMIAQASAETLTQTRDQQIHTTSPVYVAAADDTQSAVIVSEKAVSGKKIIIGNKETHQNKPVIGNTDTKRYHLFGMPYYNKVKKSHRIYFKSERQAIAEGYYKAGTDRFLTGSVLPSDDKTIRNHSILMAVDSAGLEKSLPDASPKNEKLTDIKAQDTPKTIGEPQKQSEENIQKETVKKETARDEQKDINQKLEDLQKQVNILRDLGRVREKITIGTEDDKAEQEKSILTAAGREYTMMKPGTFEMQYGLSYSYVASSEILDATSIVPRANHSIVNAIDVQYGLLKNVSAGIHFPFVYVYDKTGSNTAKDTSDWGDISLNLSYQPFKSGGDWPTTTITMGAVLPTGRSPYDINRDTDLPTGSGLYGLSLGMNMSKSIDPAIVFGSIGISRSLERDGLSQNMNGAMLEDVKPGMSFSASLGMGVAISYALSMNVSFQYGYSMSTEYHMSNSTTVTTTPSSSSASLGLGVGYRVSPLTTLSLGLGIGLTINDPDFSFTFRVPFDF